ncbi:MAG: HlyD family efflux transporter periplasmic adaptor subunit [Planctomycetaceae bacterium]|nr:HlyD family efflux transporter periplasmic adaptor subunit [Planctomycetaceae bacterium]
MNPAAQVCSPDPQDAVRQLKVTLRSDLKTTRQLHQNTPVYVVHDPVSFRTHRLSVFQYRTLASISPDLTIGENFQAAVTKGDFDADEESLYHELITSFSRLSLIVLPVANGEKLFEQHTKMKQLKRRGKLLGALFLQIPLVRPDEFLTRTVGRISWVFTRQFLVVWLLGMLAAGFIVVSRIDDLVQPLNGILATNNLPFLWLAFVGLKIWHELGHGYACKVFGGYVPEMGTILIAGTPAAYVDATAAWSFPEKYKRLVVMCGGMFFESLVFIPGVFVWAFASSPMLSSCAYQLVVMASLVTVLFNANPLMKFDGYFILCELIGIQNLRPRADAQIKRMLTRATLGLKRPAEEASLSTKFWLVAYGISATIYKFSLVISIAVMIAMKFPLVGLVLAAFHVITTVGSGAIKMTRFLLQSKETEPVRGRARLVAGIVLVGLPLLSLVVPVPFGVVTQGVVGAEHEHFLNVDSPGEFDAALVTAGQQLAADSPVAVLQNTRLREELQLSEARLQNAQLRWQVLHEVDLMAAQQEQAAIAELKKEVAELQRRVDRLTMTCPEAGKVVRLIDAGQQGRFLEPGTLLAVVVDGRPLMRTWLNEDQMGSIRQAVGTEVGIRIPGRSTTTYSGKIVSIEPAAEKVFDKTALTYIAGGEILVNPATGRPMEPIFQIDIAPSEDALSLTEHGARINVKLPRRYESIAAWAYRKCMRFVHKVLVT